MNKPTDAELDSIDMDAKAIANQNPIGTPFAWRKAYLAALVRAVLDKWGQPAHSGEPVYAFRRRGQDDFCTCTFKRYTEFSDFPEKFEMRIFYTAPQPVERKPLPNSWIRSLCAQPWIFDTVKQWVRITEAAHGIKGGEHDQS